MPLPQRRLRTFAGAVAALAIWISGGVAQAADENAPLHTSADLQLWHRKEGIVELIGHAVVSQPGETLTADRIVLDRNTRVLDASGSCVYVSWGTSIFGDEMHFNLDTRTGTVIGGRVANDRFSLTGARINKLGDGRFQTHWGEYTTCIDCPTSWSLLAEDVDMQIEGYAFMSNVTSKISDAPAFWMPYLVVPMKVRRQTGLLFPAFSYSDLNGTQFMLPFFWAINRSMDMTVAVGDYTKRGPRLTWEGRYALSDIDKGDINFYFVNDSKFGEAYHANLPSPRAALNIKQTQRLPFNIIEKLRLTELSDNLYPREIGDVPGLGELNTQTTLSFSYANPSVSAYVAASRYRTLLNTTPDVPRALKQFDPRTVQVFPRAVVSANDRLLFGLPIAGGLSTSFYNFTRSGDAFDYDSSSVPFGSTIPDPAPRYHPGVDPIRKATRLSISPVLYTSVRPFDVFSLTPSLRYHYFWYTFPGTSTSSQIGYETSNLSRGYLQFQTDLVTQFERIYSFPDDKDSPRSKHLLRPMLTYSYIPDTFTREPSHPFLDQIAYGTRNNRSGYNFDDYDIVPRDNSPLTSNYFIPLGNSLNVGFTTQWIRRDGSDDADDPSYTRVVDAAFGEAINFREYDKGGDRQPFSRFFHTLELNIGQVRYQHLYYYYPYIDPYTQGRRHTFTSSMTYILSRTQHQGIYEYDRSLSLNYSWDQHTAIGPAGTHNVSLSGAYSLSDYFLPTANVSYDFVTHRVVSAGAGLRFQSPSRCWRLSINGTYNINSIEPGNDSLFAGFTIQLPPDFSLNIAGTGFGGVTEVANTATSNK